MPIELITDLSEFQKLELEWNQLTADPLRSFDWNFSWWKHFGEGRELLLYTHRVNGTLVNVFPLFVDRWLGQSRVRIVGSGSTCTDYARIVGDESHRTKFADLVAEDLVREGHDMVEIEGVTAEGVDDLCSGLSNAGFWSYQKQLESTWILDLPDSWDAFRSRSKKSLKRKIKKAESRLKSSEFEIQSSQEELGFDQAFEILVQLHQDRFATLGKPGVFADQKFHGFLNSAARALHSTNRSEILVAFHNQQPLIAQIYLRGTNGPMLYQQGILSDKINLEPGHLLLSFAVRRAIESGHSEFDMLRGDHAYKPYWGANPVEIANIRMVAGRLLPSTVNFSYQALRRVKHFISDFSRSNGLRFDQSA